MLNRDEIKKLIDVGDLSLQVTKPKMTEKSSAVWRDFSNIYVNGVKQEYAICNHCEGLLIYKPSSGTNSLSKHIRFCQETKKRSPVTKRPSTSFTHLRKAHLEFHGGSSKRSTLLVRNLLHLTIDLST